MTKRRSTGPALTRDSDLSGRMGVIYGRRSKPDPKNPGKSTTDQIALLQEQYDRRGVVTRATLVDEGKGASVYSAAKVREAYEQIMHIVRTEPIAIVAFWELSRATRRLKIHGELMELLEERGCLLLILDRIYDPSDPDDQLALGISAVMNAAEAARTRARTLRGVKGAASMGLPHGPSPYGYQRIYDERTRALVAVEEHPEQAPIVREIAQRVLAGESSRSIMKDLNARAIPRPYGGKWSQNEIRDILTNPAYTGRRFHNGVDTAQGIWPALISDTDWRLLQLEFQQRSKSRGEHSTQAKHLLTGIVVCGRCQDQPMYKQPSSGPRGSHRAVQIGYTCPKCKRTRNAAHLEEYVVGVVNRLLGDPEALRMFLGEVDQSDEVGELDAKIKDLRSELAQAETDLGAGDISPRAFTITESRIIPIIASLEARQEGIAAKSSRLNRVLADGVTSLDGKPIAEQRTRIATIMRVRCHASRRGKGFHRESIELIPA